MRLDVVGGPQPLYARRRDADRARHRPAAPAPEIGRRPHGALQHLLGGPFGQPRLAATSRRIAQPGQPIGRKPPGPTIDLQTRYAQAFGDVLLGQSLGAQEDNFRAPTIADRDRARASPAAQLLSLVRLQLDAAPSHDCLPQWPANYYHCPVGFAILFPKHHTRTPPYSVRRTLWPSKNTNGSNGNVLPLRIEYEVIE